MKLIYWCIGLFSLFFGWLVHDYLFALIVGGILLSAVMLIRNIFGRLWYKKVPLNTYRPR